VFKFLTVLEILAEEAAFLADEAGGSVAEGGQGVEGEGVAALGGEGFELGVGGGGHALDLDIGHGDVGGGDVAEAPEGGEHLAEDGFFDFALGVVAFSEVIFEGVEVGFVVAPEEEFGGVGSVFVGVFGGILLAGFGFWAF
jgi:hypothetical protein